MGKARKCRLRRCNRKTGSPDGLCWQHQTIVVGASSDSTPIPKSLLKPRYGVTEPTFEEREQLLQPDLFRSKAEIDQIESIGLASAVLYLESGVDLYSAAEFLQGHGVAFGEIWKWGGQWRREQTNIGVSPWMVVCSTYELLANAKVWRDRDVHSPEMYGVVFHHKAVLIHPFFNGNGRYTRIYGELLARQIGMETEYGWSTNSIPDPIKQREEYIRVLELADEGEYDPLLQYALTP